MTVEAASTPKLRKAVAVEALLVVVTIGAIVIGPGLWAIQEPGLSPREIQLAIQAAQHDAGLPGVHPSGWPTSLQEAEAVISDRSTATLTLMQDDTSGLGSFRRVIVIRLSGSFPWNISTPGPGWRPPTPTANSMIGVIDAKTGEPLDGAIGNNVADISVLGTVKVLYRRA